MLKKERKKLCLGAAVLFLTMCTAKSVWAAGAVSSLGITFQYQYDEQSGRVLEPEILTEDPGYIIKDVNWSQDSAQWQPGEPVTVGIHLEPKEGYEFSYYYERASIQIQQGKFMTYWREADGKMFLKAAYYPVVQLGKTSAAGWGDEAKTIAVWEAVPYATAYQLRLYRESGEYITTLTLRGTSVDLHVYLPQKGGYYYEVRAISKDSEDALYRKNGAYVTSAAAYSDRLEEEPENGWYRTADGWSYTDLNGETASDGWRYIDGIWYYFDSRGSMMTGWLDLNGSWYYMNLDGQMQTGWLKLDGKTYYLDSTGAMAAGWYQMSPSVWYYFDADGSMVSDAEIDGYRLGTDGRLES